MRAIADAGLNRRDIDGMATFHFDQRMMIREGGRPMTCRMPCAWISIGSRRDPRSRIDAFDIVSGPWPLVWTGETCTDLPNPDRIDRPRQVWRETGFPSPMQMVTCSGCSRWVRSHRRTGPPCTCSGHLRSSVRPGSNWPKFRCVAAPCGFESSCTLRTPSQWTTT